jgi:hypothetical protein
VGASVCVRVCGGGGWACREFLFDFESGSENGIIAVIVGLGAE